MNFQPESAPNLKPSISILEKDTGAKKDRFPAHGEKITELNPPQDPSSLKKSEYNDLLVSAKEKILDSQLFFEKIIKAILTFKTSNSVIGLTDVENYLIENCLNLSDQDTESLLRQLDKKILNYFQKNKGLIDLLPESLRQISTGQWRGNIGHEAGTRGILSAINFIRSRTKFLKIQPEQKFIIGFNSRLDATTSIDFIEIILDGGDVGELNLIQVKSSVPDEEEITDIQRKHSDFANNEVMRLGDIEDLRIPEKKEVEIFEETLQNQAVMFERIFEICLDYKNSTKESLITMLGLGNLNNIQRAWILDTHFDEIKNQIEDACSEGYIEQENKDLLIRDLDSLRQTMISKAGIPKDIIKIYSVNSIIAIGSKEFKKLNIYSRDKSPLVASITK